jgi:sugar O-acyltransferase (sialic acid O-acetyltransferase NeuD family)
VFFCCAIGDNPLRKKLAERAENLGWKGEAIIDPTVVIAPKVEVGDGSYVGAMSILSPAGRIGRHVIINHSCSIGHDTILGDFSQVCPGGRVSGGVALGTGAFLGSNSVVAPGVRVGAWARVGAASFAMRDVDDGSTVVGNPARTVFAAVRRPVGESS